jgi:hypothetical protein
VVPYLIVAVGVAAIIIFVRRRRKKSTTTSTFVSGDQAWTFVAPNDIPPNDIPPNDIPPNDIRPNNMQRTDISPNHTQPVDDRLQRLYDLHTAGMLSDEEFETQRLRIVGR